MLLARKVVKMLIKVVKKGDGQILGYLCFDSFALGICFGVSYAFLFGGVICSSASNFEWKEFNFVNEKFKEKDDASIQ